MQTPSLKGRAYYAFMGTVGEVAGGYLTYRLAAKGGEETLERKAASTSAFSSVALVARHSNCL